MSPVRKSFSRTVNRHWCCPAFTHTLTHSISATHTSPTQSASSSPPTKRRKPDSPASSGTGPKDKCGGGSLKEGEFDKTDEDAESEGKGEGESDEESGLRIQLLPQGNRIAMSLIPSDENSNPDVVFPPARQLSECWDDFKKFKGPDCLPTAAQGGLLSALRRCNPHAEGYSVELLDLMEEFIIKAQTSVEYIKDYLEDAGDEEEGEEGSGVKAGGLKIGVEEEEKEE